MSVVSVGETEATIRELGLGGKRRAKIKALMARISTFGINFEEVIDQYADIDAYSQGKLPDSNFSARNMGKNDLWIAATASAFDLVLLTTDKDFDHLHDRFLQLEYIALRDFAN